MKLYRFGPIKSEKELRKAIEYTHFACFELCKRAFGKYLPIAGNIGIFSHYDDEYQFLTQLQEKLTNKSDAINGKYFRLLNPITIPATKDVPEATYTHLHIRRPDPYRSQVGDVDFILGEERYDKFKKYLRNKKTKGARIFERPDLDMIELYDPDIDALAYVIAKGY